MNRLENFTLAASDAPAMGLLASRSIATPNTPVGAPVVHIGGDISGIKAAIQSAGWRANELESLDILLDDTEPSTASCLIIDTSWSALQNRALQDRLIGSGAGIPVICVVEEADLATAVALMKIGALDVLGRPVADETLIGAIRLGMQKSEAELAKVHEVHQIKERYGFLTLRERQVMRLISSGLLNKQVAGELGISEITVKAHRGSLMRKMNAKSFASLVKMAMLLKL